MTISPEHLGSVIFAASSITTAIFWGSYLLGKLVGRMDRLEERLMQVEKVVA